MCASGDILFASLVAGQGEISFVTTNDICGGAEIIFTRQNLELTALGAAEFRIGNGGYLVWTAPQAGVDAGTVVTLSLLRDGKDENVMADTGTVRRGGNFQMNGIGAGLFAVEGEIIDGEVKPRGIISYVIPDGSARDRQTFKPEGALVLPKSTEFFAYDVINRPDMFDSRDDMVRALLDPGNYITDPSPQPAYNG